MKRRVLVLKNSAPALVWACAATALATSAVWAFVLQGVASSALQRESSYLEMNVALGVYALQHANKVNYDYMPVMRESLLLDALRLDAFLKKHGSSVAEKESARAREWMRRTMRLLEQSGYPFEKIPAGDLVMLDDPYLGKTLNKAEAVDRLRRQME